MLCESMVIASKELQLHEKGIIRLGVYAIMLQLQLVPKA